MKWLQFALVVLMLSVLALPIIAQDEPPATEEPPVTEEATTDEETAGTSTLVTALSHTHSLVRWFVVLITVALLIRLGLGLAQKSPFDAWAKRLMLGFLILITLQWLLGLVYFFVWGVYASWQWLHLVIMTVALGLAHFSNRWRKAEDATRYRYSLFIVVGVLVLIFVGVAILPQGWRLHPTM